MPRPGPASYVGSATNPKSLTNKHKKINQELAPKINKQRTIRKTRQNVRTSVRQKQSKQIC